MLASPAAASWQGPTACVTTSTTVSIHHDESCSLDVTTVTGTSARPVIYLAAKLAFNDTRAVDIPNRGELYYHVNCYNANNVAVFVISAVNNVWPGMGSVPVLAKGVFTPATLGYGYSCGIIITRGHPGGRSR